MAGHMPKNGWFIPIAALVLAVVIWKSLTMFGNGGQTTYSNFQRHRLYWMARLLPLLLLFALSVAAHAHTTVTTPPVGY
jgi:hypothetical protein